MDRGAGQAAVHEISKSWTDCAAFTFTFFHTFFISFLVAQAGTSNTMLNISGESGRPCFVSNFKGKAFRFSLLSKMLVVGLPCVAFVMLRNVPSTPTC